MSATDLDALEDRLVSAARDAGWSGATLRASVMPRSTHHWIARVAMGWNDAGCMCELTAAAEGPAEAAQALVEKLAAEASL